MTIAYFRFGGISRLMLFVEIGEFLTQLYILLFHLDTCFYINFKYIEKYIEITKNIRKLYNFPTKFKIILSLFYRNISPLSKN